jgi:hypothetical protein
MMAFFTDLMFGLPEPPSRKECNDCTDDDCGSENARASTLVGGHRHSSLSSSASA